MKHNLYYIQLINIEDMETIEISRISNSREHLIKEINAVVKCYNTHGYDINKIRVFNADKELLISYDL